MNMHSAFILSPLEKILYDVEWIVQGFDKGMSTYPLWDYVLQSVFLRMTGAQEQKMKCICWEIATVDFDLRRDIYLDWNLGECSKLKDKKLVCKHLCEALSHLHKDLTPETVLSRDNLDEIFQQTKKIIDSFYLKLGGVGFMARAYSEYIEVISSIGPCCLSSTLIFNNCDNCTHKKDTGKPFTCSVQKGLSCMYESLFRHRNRIAHNSLSYQDNRPTLDSLCGVDSVYDNYFIRFFLLIIIDKVFMALYREFKKEIDVSMLF